MSHARQKLGRARQIGGTANAKVVRQEKGQRNGKEFSVAEE